MKNSICIRIEADAKQIENCKKYIDASNISINSLSEILNLAGNSVRLKILYLLYTEDQLCVCDLSDILEMNVSAISQHLRKLKDRNIIKSKRDGQTLFYSLKPENLTLLKPFFTIITTQNNLIRTQ